MVQKLRSMGHTLVHLVRPHTRHRVTGSQIDPTMPDAVRKRIREGTAPMVHLNEKYLIRPR